MVSRKLLAHVLGIVALALALTGLAIGEAKADPAARDNWVADDEHPVISRLGDLWTMEWSEKKQAGIIILKLVKTTDAARVFEQRPGDPALSVTVSATEAEIKTEKAGPSSGKVKGRWK